MPRRSSLDEYGQYAREAINVNKIEKVSLTHIAASNRQLRWEKKKNRR